MDLKIADIRKEYSRRKLSIKDTRDDAVEQFEIWLKEALDANVPEPTAMCLATASRSGIPSSRMVLLKGVNRGKLFFYTNYDSQKSRELSENPVCSLTFFWPELERQVNIIGKSERASGADSDQYFKTRPWASQLGAWVSPQSTAIPSRMTILRDFIRQSPKYIGRNIPRPEFWGGFAIKPIEINFWQGRPSRLHDRIKYSITDSGTWKKERIAP